MKKKIIICLGFIVILGVVFGVIDYNRINNLKDPLFMVRVTTGDGSIQHYIGIGYRMKREVGLSYTEPYYMDNEIRFGLWFYTWELDFKAQVEYTYTIEVKESDSCSKDLYYSEDDRDIYLYCLDSILVNDGSSTVELRDYLNNEGISIDEFIDLFIEVDTYDDGGSKIYRELGDTTQVNGFTDRGLTILECNTIEGNKDIYLGSIDMEYDTSFCKNEAEYKTFTRTYNVKSIYIDDDEEYVYLDIEQFQGESSRVRVLSSLANEVKMGYNYEFTFQYLDNDFIDNIDSIFENTTLISIKETDKVGLEQVQEAIK